MNKRKPTQETHLLNDKFLLLSHLLRRPSMLISKPGFVKWITDKYFIFMNPGIRFPLLNYLIMRHKVFLRHLLLKKFNILSPKIDYYPKHDVLNFINLHPLIYPVAAGDRLEKDAVLDRTSLDKGLVMSGDSFFNPEVHLINEQIFSDNQIFSKDTLEKDESSVIPDGLFFPPEVHLSKNISGFPLITKQIFSDSQILPEDTSEKDEVLEGASLDEGSIIPGAPFFHPQVHLSKNISFFPLITKQIFSDNQIFPEDTSKKDEILEDTSFNKDTVRTSNIFSHPELYFSKYILNSPITNNPIFSNNKRVTYLSSKSESIKDRNRLIPTLVNQSKQFSPGTEFNSRKSDTVTERYDTIMTFKKAAKGNTNYTVQKDARPTLHYINPLSVALNDLKKTVEDIEKKVAESKSFNGKLDSENSSFGNRRSDIPNKENNNITHLTEQIYQMLERKIKIERERRGF